MRSTIKISTSILLASVLAAATLTAEPASAGMWHGGGAHGGGFHGGGWQGGGGHSWGNAGAFGLLGLAAGLALGAVANADNGCVTYRSVYDSNGNYLGQHAFDAC